MRSYLFIALIISVVIAGVVILHRTRDAFEPTTDVSVKNEAVTPTHSTVTENNDAKLTEVNKDKQSETPDWLRDAPTADETSINPFDLWKEFGLPDDLLDPELAEGTDPIDFDIRDPHAYDLLRKELVGKYGETAEVENYLQAWLKTVSSPDNMKYKLSFAKAAYQLFPSPQTLKSMEVLTAIVNDDLETLRRYSEPIADDARFLDVQPFFRTNDHVEAFRKLRAAYPKRSAEFERFILDQARNNPHMDFEKISRDIEQSYQTQTP